MKIVLDSTLPPPPHIAEVEPRSEKDEMLFADLAAVLKKHNALQRFGITLLHRHFEIEPGEVLIETTDVHARVHTIRPVEHDEATAEPYFETGWRLGDGWTAMYCKCVRRGLDHEHI